MHIYYSDTFSIPLPEGHRFPINKYKQLRKRIAASELTDMCNWNIPPAASLEELGLAHSKEYLSQAMNGALTPLAVRRIGFPWSPALMERSRRSTGATIQASRIALEQRSYAVNLAGGTHHASAEQGQGYCVFNDTAVAALVMLKERRCRKIWIVDADVHHGNGTALLLQEHPDIFTFSIHCAENFPLRKPASDLDIPLPEGSSDEVYLKALEAGLNEAVSHSQPELILYLAGADPYHGDRLGKLNLSKQGLHQRDQLVFDLADRLQAAVVVTMAGGYAPQIEDIVDIHYQTVREAASRFQRRPTLEEVKE